MVTTIMRYFVLYILSILLTIILIILSIFTGINLHYILCTFLGVGAFTSFALIFVFIDLNYTRLLHKTIGKISIKKFRTLLKHLDQENNSLNFIYENHGYILKLFDYEYKFDLKPCILKKSFLISFIVRNVRYETISETMPLYNLYRRTLKVKRYRNIIISFTKNNKKKEYYVVKEGVSRYTFLAQFVTLIKTSGKYYGCGNSIFETIRVDECDYRNF